VFVHSGELLNAEAQRTELLDAKARGTELLDAKAPRRQAFRAHSASLANSIVYEMLLELPSRSQFQQQ
jgi:hypothetical protein